MAGLLDAYVSRAIAAERARRRNPLTPIQLDLKALCFPEQIAFIEDPADQAVALCGRRAGKSSAARLLLVKTALDRPGTISALVAPTRVMGKKLHWLRLLALLRHLCIGFTSNATEARIYLSNGSEIRLEGAKDANEIERLRGEAFAMVIIEEAGVIRDDVLRVLVEDVLQWSLVDLQGKLRLIGTPPLVPVGWFVERFQGVDSKGNEVPGWSRHRWTLYQNTKLPNKAVASYLEKLRKERGLSESSATWRREVLGELVYDRDALVLSAFDLIGSVYTPDLLPKGTPTVVLGVDIGWNDPDAIIALGWFEGSPDLWVLEEFEQDHQTEEVLGVRVKDFIDRYHPMAVVGDTGGGGKKTVQGLSERIGYTIEPAHKPSVVEQFKRLNDELRARKLRVPAGGICARDAVRVRWTPGKSGVEVSKEPHSDVWPALSYAFPAARRYFDSRPAPADKFALLAMPPDQRRGAVAALTSDQRQQLVMDTNEYERDRLGL